jgi:predicted nucleic acid-binding protein
MRVLFDTDVVLDLVLDREPFADAAADIFTLHQEGQVLGHISGITVVNVFYVTRKSKGLIGAKKAVEELLATLSICPVDQLVLENAHRLTFSDYEDAVQHACATASGLEAIVTRNLADYKTATRPFSRRQICFIN